MSRPAKSAASPTTSWCCRRARRRSARRCPASTCPASSRCARCPTRGRSASGWNAVPCSSPEWTNTRASRRSGRRPARWSSAADSSAFETAENLVHRGFDVTLIEMGDQILAPLDPEMARIVEGYVEGHGIRLALNDGVAGFEQGDNGSLQVLTQSGKVHPADIVILALGVRPDTTLAKSAGLEIGQRGGIRVDEQMRTSNPDIFAVGDAIEVRDFVTGEWSLVALAGPANRQGRIAADVIAGRDSRFRGTQGTSIIGLFGAAAAWTGASEKTLKRLGDDDYEKAYLYPNSHAGYYPGARPIAIKVLFRKSDGRLLGAQALGEDNVDKRISALAMALQMGATIHDLEEAELCYAPQFGSAKDPVNFAGMVAADILRGDMPISHWASGRRVPARRARAGGTRGGKRAARGQYPVGSTAFASGRASRDRDILVICRSGGTCLLRNPDPVTPRVQGQDPVRRHARTVPLAPPGELKLRLRGT
ncbi:MAG: FAD-dependent oxidoreductase [Sulfuritalea sp.]|nr:FAD-dependent oxidoreductase [Sulfuritalea sp.]